MSHLNTLSQGTYTLARNTLFRGGRFRWEAFFIGAGLRVAGPASASFFFELVRRERGAGLVAWYSEICSWVNPAANASSAVAGMEESAPILINFPLRDRPRPIVKRKSAKFLGQRRNSRRQSRFQAARQGLATEALVGLGLAVGCNAAEEG